MKSQPVTLQPDFPEDINADLDPYNPKEILRWAFENYAPDIALATGFGPSGVVLMHLVSQVRPETTIFYLDTGLHFPETHEVRERLEEQLGIQVTRVAPDLSLEEQEDLYGPALWNREPDRCCHLRKVVPLRRFLSTRQAWITGIRRDQSYTRAHIEVVSVDKNNGLVKISPVAYWTDAEVWDYIRIHDLPYNRLHDSGYPSIGCLPCTRAVSSGQYSRAGRWAGHVKTECGIHRQAS